MRETEYARFCRAFELAATTEILKCDPLDCVVLSNDISEGPDFALLGEQGYRIVTIFHVDVVEYFTKFYLRGLVPLEKLTKFRRFSMLPEVLRLVFQKQFECVQYSARIVVPSAPMRETILRCYPECPPQKIVVVPWGDVTVPVAPTRPSGLPQLPEIADDEFVILTLSRLSPEKGIERLLQALRHLDNPKYRLHVFICGAPAYMRGQRYARKLRAAGGTTQTYSGGISRTRDRSAESRAASARGFVCLAFTSRKLRADHRRSLVGRLPRDFPSPLRRERNHRRLLQTRWYLAQTILEVVSTGRTPKTTRPETKPAASPGAAEQLVELLVRAHDS